MLLLCSAVDFVRSFTNKLILRQFGNEFLLRYCITAAVENWDMISPCDGKRLGANANLHFHSPLEKNDDLRSSCI